MIGVDIVDIEEAKSTSNWQRPRFLDKLFTLKEQQLIHNSKDPFIMVWRLWSMKEAAYKLYVQIHFGRFFSPNQFQCKLNKDAFEVTYKDFECIVNTKFTTRYILSEARLIKNEMVLKCIKLQSKDYISQSQQTNEALMILVSNLFKLSKNKLRIQKSDLGIPSIYYNTKKLELSISTSHHGYFGAFAIS